MHLVNLKRKDSWVPPSGILCVFVCLCVCGGVIPSHFLTLYLLHPLAVCSVHEKNFSLRKCLLNEKQTFIERLD